MVVTKIPLNCKTYPYIKIMLIYKKKPWLIHVPAAAVIHEWQALFIITERKEYIDNNQNYALHFTIVYLCSISLNLNV